MGNENDVYYWLPCSEVFVSTAHEDKKDIMTAKPPLVWHKDAYFGLNRI